MRVRSEQKSVIQNMRKKWRYYGHALRLGDERLAKQVLSWKPEGSRRPGRPKDIWRITIQWYMRTKELEAEDLEYTAQQ